MGESDDEIGDAVHPADALLERDSTARGGESKAIFLEGAAAPKQKKRKRGTNKTSKRADDAPSDGSPEDSEECLPGEESTPEAAGTSEGSDEGGPKAKHVKGIKRRREDNTDVTPSDRPTNGEIQATSVPKRVPQGAVLVDNDATPVSDEMINLLRKQRYFDEDFEAAAVKCFHCGGAGHMARDCNNAGKMRPCHMCAQFHGNIRCPNTLCYRCNRPGHVSRDCPYKGETPQPVCLRCGQLGCTGAGDDMARAEGACTFPYAESDLRYVRCAVCEGLGHICCKAATAPPLKPSCANCGDKGHTWEACTEGLQRTVETEMQINRTRQYASQAAVVTPSNQYGTNGHLSQGRYGYTGPSSAPDFPRGNPRHVYFDSPDPVPPYGSHAAVNQERRYSAGNGQVLPQSYQVYQSAVVQQYNYVNVGPYGSRQYTPGQYGVPPNYQANGYARQQWGGGGAGGGYTSPYVDQGYDAEEQNRARKRRR